MLSLRLIYGLNTSLSTRESYTGNGLCFGSRRVRGYGGGCKAAALLVICDHVICSVYIPSVRVAFGVNVRKGVVAGSVGNTSRSEYGKVPR
jgi:hypothetical protein